VEIILTNHAVAEFKRHIKASGTPKGVLRNISYFFSEKPQLVHANSYTLPRRGKRPKSKGPQTYLARISWKSSKVFLLLVFDHGTYFAVTALSGREFRGGMNKGRITDVREEPVDEDLQYKYGPLEYSQRFKR
jgi:hypothetical protein